MIWRLVNLPVVPTTPPAASTHDKTTTLRLSAHAEERPSNPYVHEFADQVKPLSNGKGTHRGKGAGVFFTAEVINDFVRFAYVDLGLGNDNSGEEKDDMQWQLDEYGLHFNLVTKYGCPIIELTVLFVTKPWQKVE